jgi:hypothetical protein
MTTLVNTIVGVTHKVKKFIYDFAVDGGAIGSLTSNLSLPLGAKIKNIAVNTITTVTSGGAATIDLIIDGTALSIIGGPLVITDLPAAGAFDLNVSTAVTEVPTPSVNIGVFAGLIDLVIGVAPLTAGKFEIYVEYYE